ncbi:Bestrophin, RFP-TM, chloride channel-domain-containing protein [Coprinopsis sp. MPI-PUGE-AT-0042]|nr:Bestrophin, RFP-TM, chloride channel-domain-containing protein [Coprinopsis sp. MPI-PUGE-AT-0042]
MSTRNGTMKSGLSSVIPNLAAPKIKRKHLRKYSWLPDVFRIKGSIIARIFWPVVTVSLFASFVAYASTRGYTVMWTNSIVPLLSVVVGLILVFRNSTSYERYWEGRKAFQSVTTLTRNFARQIWVSVNLPPEGEVPPHIKGKTPVTSMTVAQLRRRKIECLHLVLSFAFATKHYLRGEDGINYPDFIGVLPKSFMKREDLRSGGPRMGSPIGMNNPRSSDNSLAPSGTTTPETLRADPTKRVRAKRSKTRLSTATTVIPDPSTPLLSDSFVSVDVRSYEDASLPLPLIIAHELTRAIYGFRRDGCLETIGPAGMNGMTGMVQGLVDQLGVMERVANTPIPASYGIHLKQCVTLYLFALPLTLVHEMGWAIVPIVTVVAFTFMGIEGIAEEIEMPFGTDERDLPLERYCHDLKEEIFYVIDRLPEGGVGIHGYDDGEGDE